MSRLLVLINMWHLYFVSAKEQRLLVGMKYTLEEHGEILRLILRKVSTRDAAQSKVQLPSSQQKLLDALPAKTSNELEQVDKEIKIPAFRSHVVSFYVFWY